LTFQFGNDLATVQNRYDRIVGPNARVPAVYNTIADIAGQVGQNDGFVVRATLPTSPDLAKRS
jgi:hypothetical protein